MSTLGPGFVHPSWVIGRLPAYVQRFGYREITSIEFETVLREWGIYTYEELAMKKNCLHDKDFVSCLKKVQQKAWRIFNQRFIARRNPNNTILDPDDDIESVEFKEYPNKPGTYLIPKSPAETKYWRQKNPGKHNCNNS